VPMIEPNTACAFACGAIAAAIKTQNVYSTSVRFLAKDMTSPKRNFPEDARLGDPLSRAQRASHRAFLLFVAG
jgi:hypothetical protein